MIPRPTTPPDPPCVHDRTQTLIIEAHINGVWMPSTIYNRCRSCRKTLSVKARAAAFMTDNIPRRAGDWTDDK